MKFSRSFYRSTLFVSAAVVVFVALILAIGVIQPVNAEVLRGATSEKAVLAFWVIVGLNLLLALTLFLVAMRSNELSWISKFGLVVLGLVVLLFGFGLADAASAYRSHGPAMQSASIFLFICAAADFLVGGLAIAAAVLFPKKGLTE